VTSLVDIASALPNGFHDSYLLRADIDYASRQARIYLDVWVGDLAGDVDEIREAMRQAVVTIDGLAYFVAEPADKGYDHDGAPPWIVAVGSLSELRARNVPGLPNPGPEDAFENYLHINNWNTCIYICGRHAFLQWAEARG
jgi:hypothetical protein